MKPETCVELALRRVAADGMDVSIANALRDVAFEIQCVRDWPDGKVSQELEHLRARG